MNDPLFVSSLDALKERLRLSGVPSTASDTLAILDDSVLRARLEFYRRLGEPRVATLLAITYTENPNTRDGVLRALANTVEVDLVHCGLMERLPHAWMDSSGDANKRWNEEAPFRETGSRDIDNRILRCRNRIEEDMQMLAGDEDLGSETEIQTYDGTPTFTRPQPGDSLRPRRGRFFGDC